MIQLGSTNACTVSKATRAWSQSRQFSEWIWIDLIRVSESDSAAGNKNIAGDVTTWLKSKPQYFPCICHEMGFCSPGYEMPVVFLQPALAFRLAINFELRVSD